MREKLYFIRLPSYSWCCFLLDVWHLEQQALPMKLGIACSPWSFCKPIWRSYGEPIGRRYRGYRVGESIQTAVTIVLVSQILIWTATAASYLVGINTFFNYPVAITGSTRTCQLRNRNGCACRRTGGELHCCRDSRRARLVFGWINSSGAEIHTKRHQITKQRCEVLCLFVVFLTSSLLRERHPLQLSPRGISERFLQEF